MTVAELIRALGEMPQDASIVIEANVPGLGAAELFEIEEARLHGHQVRLFESDRFMARESADPARA